LYMLRLTYKIFPVERDLPRPLELRTRRETDLVQFLIQAFSSSALGQTDRSLAKRVLSSDQAELIVAGLLADHLGAHPKATDTAAALRREAVPPAVVEESRDKRKKKKKKKDKHKSETETETEFETEPADAQDTGLESAPIPAAVLAATDEAQPAAAHAEPAAQVHAQPRIHPQPQVHAESQAHDQPRPPKHGSAERQGRPRTQHKPTHVEFDAATSDLNEPGGMDLEDMDVISAADLLSAEEQALLRGETPDSPRAESRAVGASVAASKQARIFVNVGQDDEVTEDDFLDTLADTGFPIGQVAGITLKPHHTFIVVPRELLGQALACLNDEDVAGLQIRAEEARERKPGRSFASRDGRRNRDRNRSRPPN
ncbi:MAG TPA: DbpA RNA binding domain-containing protein, partial [Polyangiaceae bacterium]|nr:DbpA RNA binding domain-containing protein [Polyangiaceae bacterium]